MDSSVLPDEIYGKVAMNEYISRRERARDPESITLFVYGVKESVSVPSSRTS